MVKYVINIGQCYYADVRVDIFKEMYPDVVHKTPNAVINGFQLCNTKSRKKCLKCKLYVYRMYFPFGQNM